MNRYCTICGKRCTDRTDGYYHFKCDSCEQVLDAKCKLRVTNEITILPLWRFHFKNHMVSKILDSKNAEVLGYYDQKYRIIHIMVHRCKTPKITAMVCSHESLHHALLDESKEACDKFDNIALRLEQEGYL